MSLKIYYTKVTHDDRDFKPPLNVWYCTAIQTHATIEKSCANLNKIAKARGIRATYEVATREEYTAYYRAKGENIK